ncbi:MAG: DNA helicase IV [Gammaproteobacteria bacterium]|nr:DNA helicase IV [Gammaproteobacteria bacterium]
MNTYEIKNNWLTNLLFRHPASVLTLQSKGLQVSDGKKKMVLPFSRMSSLPKIKRRLFWSHLSVTTAKKSYLYKGFSASQLRQFSELLNDSLKLHVQQQLQAEYQEAKQLKAEIQAFLDASSFRRSSQCRQLVERCCRLLKNTSVYLRECFATSSQLAALKYSADFVSFAEEKVKRANTKFLKQELLRCQSFFDHIEKNPLTLAQRKACIINEDHNLVLAGAGTGKTSTMIGRAGYLLATEQTAPEQILMLAYAKKAAGEMQERQDQCLRTILQKHTPAIKTFHALGLEIIGKVDGKRPAITSFAEDNVAFARFVTDVINRLMADASYKSKAAQFCANRHHPKSAAEFSQLMADFLMLFKQSYLTFDELSVKAGEYTDVQRFSLLMALFEPLLSAYQQHLAERNEIDFADMIGKAISYVESGRYQSPYQHILVDEFQDISQERARLIKALLTQRNDTVLFAVGDDWQSIYRFTGSDISITRQFKKMFGASALTALDTTFRFNNKIGDVASAFVLKNPDQIKKTINSVSVVSNPAISLIRIPASERGLHLALNAISQKASGQPNQKTTVAVLARFNFIFGNESPGTLKQQMERQYPQLDIEFMSVHASKGKEADYVITLGLTNGKYGFPSQKETDPILEFLLPEKETFSYAEERRLFYVALTRARHRVYLVYHPAEPSPFISELINQKYPVCTDEFVSAC